VRNIPLGLENNYKKVNKGDVMSENEI